MASQLVNLRRGGMMRGFISWRIGEGESVVVMKLSGKKNREKQIPQP
jgi:hypothetical protein